MRGKRAKEVRRKKEEFKADLATIQGLEELRAFVDNFNATPDLALRGGVYKELSEAEIHITTINGVEFGYKIEDNGLYMKRFIFVKVLGYKIAEIPEEQIEPIILAVMESCIDKGMANPEIYGPGDTIRIRIGKPPKRVRWMLGPNVIVIAQNFMPLVMTELNPNLVSISNRPTKH